MHLFHRILSPFLQIFAKGNTPPTSNRIITETGDYIITEDGNYMIME